MGQDLTPLEALRRNPLAITDAVYGDDHPMRGKNARKAPPVTKTAAVPSGTSRVGDLLDANTKSALNGLKWRLERAANKRKGKKDA